MIQLGISARNFDPVHSLGTAVLYQALADLKQNSPKHTIRLRALCDDTNCSQKTRARRIKRYNEAVDIWDELVEWVGSPDFFTVVGWSGFEVSNVRKVFDTVLAEFGIDKSNNTKRRKRGKRQ